jgi:hypothetical protein
MPDLGEYKGLPIKAQTVSLKNAGDGLSKAIAVRPVTIEPGQELDLLVRVKAGNEIHKIDDIDHPTSWTLEQTFSAQTITIVDRDYAQERIGAQLLAEAKLKEAEDRRKGIQTLPGTGLLDKGDIVHTDENGVLLTPAEYAERTGRGEMVVETTPIIAVFNNDDDDRRLWPDEFKAGDPRPQVGDVVDGFTVTSLLDPVTGAVVAPLLPEPEFDGQPISLTGDLRDDVEPAFTEDDVEWMEISGAAEGSSPAPHGADPEVVDFLAGQASTVVKRVGQQMSLQLLRQALDVETGSPKPRAGVVEALEARIGELS